MKTIGAKHTIMVGLLFEMLQLMWSVLLLTLTKGYSVICISIFILNLRTYNNYNNSPT